jgi:hypothetical protein
MIANPLIYILFGFIGGRIIAEDIEYKSLEQYFIRIRRSDYLIGKLLAVFISYFGILLLIVAIFYWLLSNAFSLPLFAASSLDVLLKILLFIFAISACQSLFMLALSGATEKKNYASLMFIILMLASGQIFSVFAQLLKDNFYYRFSPQETMATVLFGLVPPSDAFGELSGFFFLARGSVLNLELHLEFGDGVQMLFIYSVASFIFIYRKITNFWR